MMARVKHLLPFNCRKSLYYSFFYSHIYNYCMLVYGTASATTLIPIITQQKRFIRHVCGVAPLTHTNELFMQCQFVPFVNLYTSKLLRALYRSSPTSAYLTSLADLQEFFNLSYNFRERNKYVIPKVNADYSKQSLIYITPNTLNKYEHIIAAATSAYICMY